MTVVGLTCAWIYFSYEAVLIFADTYTRGFIALAIKEQKVIYNISWEDPRVEREELKLSSDDVVLTISSAGCNVLDYLWKAEAHHGSRPERGPARRFWTSNSPASPRRCPSTTSSRSGGAILRDFFIA